MKSSIILLITLLCATAANCAIQFIACGTQPGEIYVTGFTTTGVGWTGFYYSSDYGEHIVLRDSASPGFGALIPDAADSTTYRLTNYAILYTTDNGFSWNAANTSYVFRYASGIIPGEVYRQMENSNRIIERSDDFGHSFIPCSCTGYPDSIGIASIALGSDSGQVYINGGFGHLYFSADYADNFTFLGNMYAMWGMPPEMEIINGAIPGEAFFYFEDAKKIWRITDYGAHAELIVDFPPEYTYWFGSVASSRTPGELYFLATRSTGYEGGYMRIVHTTNYFQDWTEYIHEILPTGIRDNDKVNIPISISLDIWPNPANAGFNISYDLSSMQDVQLVMYNMLGQNVWRYKVGMQSPGNYHLNIKELPFPSGKYFLRLQTQEEQISKTFTIIK